MVAEAAPRWVEGAGGGVAAPGEIAPAPMVEKERRRE
jgi:hypothetical protein